MRSIFRIYAKTSKGNDAFLHNQLVSMGLKPKYEQLLHSFYCNANFNDIFKLSFNSFTVQNLYLQLGHRFPLTTARSSTHTQNQQLFSEYLRKINFKNYLPIQKNLVQNITLKIFIRQSSPNLPSQNAMLSLLQNYLNKQVIMKQYQSMFKSENEHKQLQNYYDIKQIVQKKWQFEEMKRQQIAQSKLLQNKKNSHLLGGKQLQQVTDKPTQLAQSESQVTSLSQLQIPYQPHFILYIRRNHARLLLKLNKQSMHKFGFKKNVGWGPIKQTLTASLLYRTGLLQKCKNEKNIKLWDPFCGSGTIPLVALSMLKSLRIHKQIQRNFVWSYWPIYNPTYLTQYLNSSTQPNNAIDLSIFGSDIDISAVRNSIQNFKQIIATNKQSFNGQPLAKQNAFLKYKPSDQIFEVLKNSIYVGCGDFQQMGSKIFNSESEKQKVNIVTNLPYLGERSKEHYPLNQLHSIYKRFDAMISKYNKFIGNVFVVIDSQTSNKNHFVKVTKQQWILLDNFNNGGIEVCLLGWANNSLTFKLPQVINTTTPKNQVLAYDKSKTQNLVQYRKQKTQIDKKKYQLPKYLNKSEGLRGVRRIRQKKKARHLRAAYQIFAKKRDKNALFEKYARKTLALRLSQRGKSWRRKNISIVGDNLQNKQGLIKAQFQSRVEQALKRSQAMKARKKNVEQKVKRKW